MVLKFGQYTERTYTEQEWTQLLYEVAQEVTIGSPV